MSEKNYVRINESKIIAVATMTQSIHTGKVKLCSRIIYGSARIDFIFPNYEISWKKSTSTYSYIELPEIVLYILPML